VTSGSVLLSPFRIVYFALQPAIGALEARIATEGSPAASAAIELFQLLPVALRVQFILRAARVALPMPGAWRLAPGAEPCGASTLSTIARTHFPISCSRTCFRKRSMALFTVSVLTPTRLSPALA
jgi:hypothetical protein